jgi:peptidyl-dipeptidase Dcp
MSKTPLALMIAASLSLGACATAPEKSVDSPSASAAAEPAAAPVANPFFAPSTLPYQYPRFDQIKDSDYAPAFEEGMRQQRAEMDAIANDPEAPTFENTIVAMERSGQLLTRVSNVFFNLAGANTNDAMKAVQREMSPKLAAHSDAINLNPKLFARVKALYDNRAATTMDPESAQLLERYHTDFVRAGANLNDADKETLKKLNAELAQLSTEFGQKTLDEVNDSALVVDTKEELAGLSDAQIQAAAAEACKR